MKNQVKALREAKNMTQSELAKQSGLSLRTVQRVEAGGILKGFSLKALAQALAVNPEHLISHTIEQENIQRAKIINLSALSGIIIPFGGVIIPLILTYQTQDPKNKELGKSIVGIQIILAAIFSASLIISPFVQKYFSLNFPLFIVAIIMFLSLKILVIISNGMSLNKKHDIHIKLKTNFL
ncbi:helix-turn-helix domain-containing protein [Chryseobacterium pennipullorum]|uniref:XRE family transcriptional regulator n=1 Tax=Chryseobacterium pennipullorum TaxID=2258963 RepID=A0A3D9AZF7_9FLAO|nr:helix-turn-helix domain-containing protein [Chryseobacterium pennipullorum]REC46730.1 XRE family transcriptional regulator [Chryseobacterium pennipullorum]